MRLLSAVLASLLLLTAAGPVSAQPVVPDGDPATTDRIVMNNPVSGAVAISQQRFPTDTVNRVVLATANGFADSLAAAPLLTGSPLLLTPPGELPAAVQDEIGRLLSPGDEIFLLGGVAAISQQVHDLLADQYSVTRLAGPDRIGTAIAIVDLIAGRTGAGQVIAVARAFGDGSAGWADAITGSAWAANTGTPLVLTSTGTLDNRVADLLGRLATQTTIVLGGTAAISDSVAGQLPDPRRISGPDRTTTAATIATQLWGPSAGYVIVNGYAEDGWAAALPAAGLAADLDHPMLLADVGVLPDATRVLVGLGCGTGPAVIETTLVGNTAALAGDLVGQIDLQDGGECPRPPIQIRGDGLGLVPVGTSDEDTIAILTDALGPPSNITEEMFPFCGTTGAGRGRIYTWGGVLDIYINDPTAFPDYPGEPGNPGNGQPFFWGAIYGGYDYNPATQTFSLRSDSYGFTTDRGIGLASTNADVQDAYGNTASFDPGFDKGYPPPNWTLPGGLRTFAAGRGSSDPQESFFIGTGCGE